MKLKELRKEKKLTQQEASKLVQIPLRTYVNYENDATKEGSLKYRYIMDVLTEHNKIDEEHGVLSIEEIKTICHDVFQNYDIEYCYLFGSYAKGYANDTSDVDLMISTDVSGLTFYGLIENLRENLHKKVDLLTISDLYQNPTLLNEILKDGKKIYEQHQRT